MLRSYQFKNKTKSVTRTIRIDEDIDFQLEKLAHEQRVSVNYFANQALRKFVERKRRVRNSSKLSERPQLSKVRARGSPGSQVLRLLRRQTLVTICYHTEVEQRTTL